MATGSSASVSGHFIRSNLADSSRTARTVAPIPVRISTGGNNGTSTCDSRQPPPSSLAEGPSCIFVGPIETARKETLEALYRQARDAYYSGSPLIVDDMFDKVELKLRWYGSKCVVKYPRCSLRRQSTYADAEEDRSQVLALASVWLLFLGFGASVCIAPLIYAISRASQDALDSAFNSGIQASALDFLATLNDVLFMMLGSAIGYPIASASVGALQGLWKNDLVALKGACPNCGEEVFAFLRPNQSNKSSHRAECHVCECSLEFRAKVEKSIGNKRWVHGRVYLIKRGGRNGRQRRY